MQGQFWYKAKRDQDGTIRERDSKKLTGTNSSGPENCGPGQPGGTAGNPAPPSDRAHFRSSFPHSMSLSSTRRQQQVIFMC